MIWGQLLGPQSGDTYTHICFMGNKTSSVSWTNKLGSPNLLGHNINRALGLAQIRFRLYVSERHLPGCRNVTVVSLPPDLVPSPIWLSLSPASAHRYKSALGQLFAYNRAHGIVTWLPRDHKSHSRLVVAWLDALWHGRWGPRCRSKTLRSRLSAISWCHRPFCGFAVTLIPQADLYLKALGATETTPRSAKHAVTPELLWAARVSLNLSNASDRVLLGERS
jgi:hypothetical protein